MEKVLTLDAATAQKFVDQKTRKVSFANLKNLFSSPLNISEALEITPGGAQILASQLPDEFFSFSALTELTPLAAKHFAEHRGTLRFYLPNISDSAAEELGKKKEGSLTLELNGNLSTGAAKALSFHHEYSLRDSGPFLRGLWLGFKDFESDEAAEALIYPPQRYSYQPELVLSVDRLSDGAGRALGGWKGDRLYIILETEEISTPAASGLSEFRGGELTLCIKALPVDVASALSWYRGPDHDGRLSLETLEEISDESASALSEFYGSYLGLNKLRRLSDAAAESLAGSSVRVLDLQGLKELTDESARIFAHHFPGKGEFTRRYVDIGYAAVTAGAAAILEKSKIKVRKATRPSEPKYPRLVKAEDFKLTAEGYLTWNDALRLGIPSTIPQTGLGGFDFESASPWTIEDAVRDGLVRLAPKAETTPNPKTEPNPELEPKPDSQIEIIFEPVEKSIDEMIDEVLDSDL